MGSTSAHTVVNSSARGGSSQRCLWRTPTCTKMGAESETLAKCTLTQRHGQNCSPHGAGWVLGATRGSVLVLAAGGGSSLGGHRGCRRLSAQGPQSHGAVPGMGPQGPALPSTFIESCLLPEEMPFITLPFIALICAFCLTLQLWFNFSSGTSSAFKAK